jgi:hypothetical protein
MSGEGGLNRLLTDGRVVGPVPARERGSDKGGEGWRRGRRWVAARCERGGEE